MLRLERVRKGDNIDMRVIFREIFIIYIFGKNF